MLQTSNRENVINNNVGVRWRISSQLGIPRLLSLAFDITNADRNAKI
jgi:hypothetical protein